MKHYQIIYRPYRPERSIYYEPPKHLTNPVTDVLCVAVLAVILVVAWYVHP
jgi:hypothetical protein